jgi:hypothetical protein
LEWTREAAATATVGSARIILPELAPSKNGNIAATYGDADGRAPSIALVIIITADRLRIRYAGATQCTHVAT